MIIAGSTEKTARRLNVTRETRHDYAKNSLSLMKNRSKNL